MYMILYISSNFLIVIQSVSKWLNIKVRALISLTKHSFISSSCTREIEDSILFFDSDVVVSAFLYLFFAFMIPLIFS